MTTVKHLPAVMEYDEGDVSIRLPGAFAEVAEVSWDEKFLLAIGRDGDDLVITFSLPNNRLHLDVGDSPAQQALFTPEADTAEGKLPAPAPRR